MPYQDLRSYVRALEGCGLVHHITAEVDKDWEIAAVTRRVFQRVAPEERKALVFDRVRGFEGVPVVVGVVGASRRIYAEAIGATLETMDDRWDEALRHPIPPRSVATSPVKANILRGDEIDITKLLPIPVWTVGEDPGPYITSPLVVTEDPETHIRNLGTYRAQVKGPRKVGVNSGKAHHGLAHFRKYAALGQPCPCAIVIGADPTVMLLSVTSVQENVEELAVAGGLRGEPVETVRCETVPLEVPASAEVVIEGWIPTDRREMEGPFGEYTGYMGLAELNYYMDISCVTFRDRPMYHAFFSQMPPSESSLIRQIGREKPIKHHLKDVLGLPVRDVCLREAGGATAWLIISLHKTSEDQPLKAIRGAWEAEPSLGKLTVVVDDDIDPRDDFMVDWAVAFRFQPDSDMFVEAGAQPMRLDPSVHGFGDDGYSKYKVKGSKVGIDATKKHPYPAMSLPPREHLELVDRQWDKYGFSVPDIVRAALEV